MGLMSLPDYAKLKNKDRTVVFRMAKAGRLKSAVEISGRLYVDGDEPYPDDSRIKSGKYIGARARGDTAERGSANAETEVSE